MEISRVATKGVLLFLLNFPGGYAYLSGYAYYFCQIFPGATFIWGATLIRESRVCIMVSNENLGPYSGTPERFKSWGG